MANAAPKVLPARKVAEKLKIDIADVQEAIELGVLKTEETHGIKRVTVNSVPKSTRDFRSLLKAARAELATSDQNAKSLRLVGASEPDADQGGISTAGEPVSGGGDGGSDGEGGDGSPAAAASDLDAVREITGGSVTEAAAEPAKPAKVPANRVGRPRGSRNKARSQPARDASGQAPTVSAAAAVASQGRSVVFASNSGRAQALRQLSLSLGFDPATTISGIDGAVSKIAPIIATRQVESVVVDRLGDIQLIGGEMLTVLCEQFGIKIIILNSN